MTIEYRPILPAEVKEFGGVNLTAFGERLDSWHETWFQRRFQQSSTLAAFSEGRMVGSSMTLPVVLGIPGATVNAAGVTAVGVLPTHRRQGLMRGMMTRLLADAREQGFPMAVLWASEGGIYSRFGFGPAARSLKVEMEHPKARLRPQARVGSVRLVGADQARTLFGPVHTRLVEQRPGMIGRNDTDWDYALSDDDPHRPRDESQLFMVAHDGATGCDGYLLYRVRGNWSPRGPEGTLVINEMVALDPEVAADLWRYCTEIDLIRRIEASGRGCRPVDDPILWLAMDPQAVVATLTTTVWACVLDIPALLARRRYQQDGDLTIRVEEAQGAKTYHLQVRAGVGRCTATRSKPEVTLGLSDLGSICLGQRCLTQLQRAGRVGASSPEAARHGDDLLAWDPPPWCFEDI